LTKNKKITVGFILAGAAIMIMMFTSMPSAGSKEITITDLVENSDNFAGDYIMTQGLLNKDSIQWNADKIELQFEIYDENGASISVFHKGIKPDNFTDDIIVILEGFMNGDGVLEAEKIQTKCPTKYEEEDMDNYDPTLHKEIVSDK
jgi:cytochrome c-type biogenesis protein CcmE